ncbi:MAG: iron ABC transporter permease [Pseudomonadota bacterium]
MPQFRPSWLARHLVWISAVLVCLAALLDASLGATQINWWTLLSELDDETRDIAQQVFIQIRLPRVVLVVAVGFSLAMSGAALQGLFQNPLADASLLGVSSAASLGAVLALFYGLYSLNPIFVPICGLLGAALSVVMMFALVGRHASNLSLILSGVAISSVMASLIALALNFSDNPYAMSEMIFWLLGSLDNKSLQDVYLSVPFMVVGCALLYVSRHYLDALSLGEDTATTLGFSTTRYRALIILGVGLSVGAAVSMSGSIGFVGLVVPHLLRPIVSNRPSKLLIPSGLVGALMLLLADSLVQTLASQQASSVHLKLGVVTSLIGGPFFLWLLYRLRTREI